MAVRPITIAPQQLVGTVAPLQGFEGTSQTFGAGAVVIETAARLTEGAADLTSGLVGIAADAASGTAAAAIEYYPALPGVIFEANLATAGSLGTYALALNDFLTRYALQRDTSQTPAVWFIDQGDTTNVSVTIIGFRDDVGTVDGRVYFQIYSDVTPYST